MRATPNSTDVFIVGGGPAGLAAAIAARHKGFDVTVADGSAPPIEKPCGEGMMPETLHALASLGVLLNDGEGHRFRGISFELDGTQFSADFPQGQGIGIRRTLLHERLVESAAACGVRLLWNTPVTGISGSHVHLARQAIRARWIIGADGHASRVRRWSGLDSVHHFSRRFAARRHYRLAPWSPHMEFHWGRDAQAYVTPIAQAEVCVAMVAQSACSAEFDRALATMPALRERLASAPLAGRQRGAVTAMHSLRRVRKNNVALLGDASGGVDAITGEGLRLAFSQAFALADAMLAGNLAQYQAAHRALSRRPMLMGRLMLLLANHPRLRSRIFRAFQSSPDLFSRFLAVHVGHSSPLEICSTGAQLGLRLLTGFAAFDAGHVSVQGRESAS